MIKTWIATSLLFSGTAFGYGIVGVSAGADDNQQPFVKAEVRILETILKSSLSLGLSYDKHVSKIENISDASAGLFIPLSDSRRVMAGIAIGQRAKLGEYVHNYGEFSLKIRLWP